MRALIYTLLTILIQQTLFAQCNSGNVTISGNSLITGSCKITGDLTILNGATLNVDLTSAAPDTFVVQGNILIQGSGILWVHAAVGSTGEQFIVSNSYNNQRTITTNGSGKIQLENIEFRTQEGNLTGASSIYMNYNANDSSIFYVSHCTLNTQTAWVLFNLFNKATLLGYEAQHIPTELYLQDTAQVSLHGQNTNLGIWLNFQNITDTLNLPPNQSTPFSYAIGRGAGGLNTPWYLEMDTVQSGMGVQIFPSTQLTINGAGFPNTGELKVALMFANGTDTLQNLYVGLQNTTVDNGANGIVTLSNVNLGPVAWQIYALMNENLFINNSIINELGIAGPSSVVADSSLFQLAVLASAGVGGSSMIISNSQIWNQEINAANNSTITLNNCDVYGSHFRTTDTLSHILVNGGCFFQNPTGCTPATMVNIATGQPNCNPFIPSGFPQILTPTTISLNGVNNNCVTNGIEDLNYNNSMITIYPNPFSNRTTIQTNNSNKNATLIIYNSFGQTVKEISNISGQTFTLSRDNLSSGLYFIRLTEPSKILAEVKFVIID